MNIRIASVAGLVLSFALPELALARVQPAATAPATAAPAPVSAPVAEPAAVVVAPSPAAVVVAPSPAAVAVAPSPAAVVVAPSPTAVVVAPSVPSPVATPRADARLAPPSLRSGKQMVAAGATTLGTMYFFSTLAGALAIDRGGHRQTDPSTGMLGAPDQQRIHFGRALLIPIVGPFIAMGHTDSAMQRWGAAMTGVAQVTGAVLVLAGSIRKARARRWERMSFGAGPAQGGATISLSGRF